jgi:hypothetical protein
MIAIVVVIFLIEKIISLTKILKILEVKSEDIYLLKSVGKTAVAALLAGVVLFLFYWTTRDSLPGACLNFSRGLLAFVKLEKLAELFGGSLKLEKLAELFGGSLFLAICSAIYFSVYLFLVNWLDALESHEKERIGKMISGRQAAIKNLFRRKKEELLTVSDNQSANPDEQIPPADHRPLTTDH